MNIDKEKFERNICACCSIEAVKKLLFDCKIKPVDCNECAMSEEENSIVCMSCENNKGLHNNFIQKKKEWYEDKNNFPCFCWVSDKDNSEKADAVFIDDFIPNKTYPFRRKNIYWRFATPVTKKEVLNYCVGEK